MLLSDENYFKFQELVKTDTGLDNSPTSPDDLVNLAGLWKYLNYVREKLGKPIFINSAYRTDAVNKQVKGAKRSYHKSALASDIRTYPEYMNELREILLEDKSKFKEFIDYKSFFHFAI